MSLNKLLPLLGKPGTEYVRYKPKTKGWKAYCAIDVGAISCGYAYSFKDSSHIWENDNWADHLCYYSPRTPSAVLYDSDQVPVAYGFDACEKYKLMSKQEAERATFAYDGLLHHGETVVEQRTSLGASAADDSGVSTSIDEYTQLVRETVLTRYADLALFLGRHFKERIKSTYKRFPDEMVWCFVVPLSWDADCKSCYVKKVKELYLHEYEDEFAEQKCKIKVMTSTEALWLALRDDARKLLKQSKLSIRKDKKKEKAAIFVHSGASKTEVSLHKKKTGRVPVATTSLDVGGHCLNKMFEELMMETLGSQSESLAVLQKQNPPVWLNLLLSFENAKDSLMDSDVALDIDYGFSEAMLKVTGKELSDLLPETSSTSASDPIAMSQMGQFIPSKQKLQEKYEAVASTIATAVKELTENNEVEVSGIALSGGLGGSPFMKHYFVREQESRNMPPVKLQVPDHASMLLVRGAVVGSKDDNCKKVYNTFVVHWYHKTDESKSPSKQLTTINGQKVLEKVYPILHKGEDIQVGKSVDIGPFSINDFYHDRIWFDIYKLPRNVTPLKDPMTDFYNGDYVKSEEKIGKLRVIVPSADYGQPHAVHLHISMDLVGFKATMTLTSSPQAEKSFVVCKYT